MFFTGIGTATPPRRYTKAECWNAFQESDWFARLDRRSHAIAEAILLRDNGISARRLALDSLAEGFAIDPDTLQRRFATHAPTLATEAAVGAMRDAGIGARDIDAIVVSTCTGYLCPGLTSYLAERLGLSANIQAFDLVGQGCGAALPNLRLADALIAASASQLVLSVCVEVSSAAMYLDNDPGVLVSACLFGDGAGAAVLSARPVKHKRQIEWRSSSSVLAPGQRDALRFEQRGGMLRNILTRPVPALAAEHAQTVLEKELARAQLKVSDIVSWIMHAGGRDVLQALRERIGLSVDDLRYSAAILDEYGNMSSAFVYFVLKAALEDHAPQGWWWMSAFGAGFTCHGALLAVGARE
ncbi:MAG TPA: 3-oxoacyl-[acyl-carrier-protein] synthase III C-terminal domain-containing protein [Longimicrobiales bacterium]|nr:3-oxoacyl-[acyl-carrier-protein] synthase III C-terminal domain-containing protein [Longimicrobiales bacterium]